MEGTSLAEIITAVATVLTALGGLVLSVGVMIPNLRATRQAVAVAREAKQATDQVHTIVNQSRTDLLRYQLTLVETLRAAGVEVPADQSLQNVPPTS